MKTTTVLYITTTLFAFLGTYFFNLGAANAEQYLAVVSVVFIDGFFGIWAGIKTEGFRTNKALKVLQTLIVWVISFVTLFKHFVNVLSKVIPSI